MKKGLNAALAQHLNERLRPQFIPLRCGTQCYLKWPTVGVLDDVRVLSSSAGISPPRKRVLK